MIKTQKELFVNMPLKGQLGGYVFSLPEQIFLSKEEASKFTSDGEEVQNLETALARIYKDIAYDA